jgi:SNF2 family DNA or RNA helicase
MQDEKGKYSRIASWRLEQFREMTKSFIIRRDKSVLALPPFRRAFETIYIENEKIKLAYNKALENLRVTAESHSNLSYFDVQENLMTLRRITGMGKVPFAVEYIDTFLDTEEDEKIAIGIHHESVRDALYYELTNRGFQVLKYSGEDTPEQKNRIQHQFQDPHGPRVLIVNMIAGGVGLNLQACNNTLILERQWNAADEEQFEGRFWRQGQTRPVLAEYMLAKGTIDTYFAAMVENKRQVCGEALDGWQFTNDSDAIRELIEKTLASKL